MNKLVKKIKEYFKDNSLQTIEEKHQKYAYRFY